MTNIEGVLWLPWFTGIDAMNEAQPKCLTSKEKEAMSKVSSHLDQVPSLVYTVQTPGRTASTEHLGWELRSDWLGSCCPLLQGGIFGLRGDNGKENENHYHGVI